MSYSMSRGSAGTEKPLQKAKSSSCLTIRMDPTVQSLFDFSGSLMRVCVSLFRSAHLPFWVAVVYDIMHGENHAFSVSSVAAFKRNVVTRRKTRVPKSLVKVSIIHSSSFPHSPVHFIRMGLLGNLASKFLGDGHYYWRLCCFGEETRKWAVFIAR